MKTSIEIERDFYAFTKGSKLATYISGGVFYADERPENSDKEDVTIKQLYGYRNGLHQEGVMLLRVFLNRGHITKGKRMSNRENALTVLKHIQELAEGLTAVTLYKVTMTVEPTIEQIEELNQTCITARLNYELIN